MAGDSLIERYLDALDRRLGKRRDREDLIDEVADHLYSAADGWEAAGITGAEAERRAVERFGRTDLVASIVTAVPASSGRTAGFLSRHLVVLGATATMVWLAVSAFVLYSLFRFRGMYWDDQAYMTTYLTIAIAIVVTIPVLLAINVRVTGVVDDWAMAIALIGVVAAFMALTLLWTIVAWLVPLALAVIWTFARTWRVGVGSRAGTVATILILSMTSVTMLLATFLSAADAVDQGVIDALVLSVVLGTLAILPIGFADVSVRAAYQTIQARALTA